eukprot:scaffold28499_cov65-Phaeocystis_antarctica.AAC.8
MLEGAESCAVVSGASSEVASRRRVAPVHRRMQPCRRVVRVARGVASRSPACSSVVGVRRGRSWWVSRSMQGSTPETHRVASDAPAEALSDHNWVVVRASDPAFLSNSARLCCFVWGGRGGAQYKISEKKKKSHK